MTKSTSDKSVKTPTSDPEHVQDALQQAEKDIAKDPDLSIHSPNNDLDEGELANLGGDKNDLV